MTEILDITKEDTLEYITQGEKISMEGLLYITDLFMEMESRLRYASSPRILLETITIKAAMADQMRFSDTVEERLTALENLWNEKASMVFQAQPAAPVQAVAPLTKETKGPAGSLIQKIEQSQEGAKAAPARAAAAKASPQGAEKQAPQNEEQIWGQVMKMLQKNQAGIFGQLREGRFSDKKGKMYQVEFNKTNVFMANYLNNEGRKEIISGYLKEITGETVGFEAVLQQEKEEEKESQQDLLQTLFQDFGRGNVQVDDD